MKKNVLLIAPTNRERTSLPPIAKSLDINVIWDDFAGDYFDDFLETQDSNGNVLDIVKLIEETIAGHQSDNLAGVTSGVGYPGMSVVAIIAERIKLKGPQPQAIMLCEHKYLSRLAQADFVPDATPWFTLIDPKNPELPEKDRYPLFMKPVKSCMSMNAFVIENEAELRERLGGALLPRRFFLPFDDMVKTYSNLAMSCGYLLLEELLSGHQVSLEGYVYNGEPVVMGILDAVMFDHTFSFKRFQYPSQLPPRVQQHMIDIAVRFMRGIQYDNAMFNMEMMWKPDTDRVSIIEVNPKIASQFPDLFEKVDGVSTYRSMLQIAIGDDPQFPRGQGKFAVAGSCVLRIFEDKKLLANPTPADLAKVKEKYPDALISLTVSEGKNLSDVSQDTASYRYGLVNIGAASIEALEQKFEEIKKMLPFEFAPVARPQPAAKE